MITLSHLFKTYHVHGQSVVAVRDVSLTIADKTIFGVIGFSGAGKSTLVRMINYLEVPDQGQVLIDGIDLATLSEKALRQRRQRIGMIFQQFNLLWSMTVAQNIAFPLHISGVPKAQIDAKVQRLLKLVDLEDKAQAYPHSYPWSETACWDCSSPC